MRKDHVQRAAIRVILSIFFILWAIHDVKTSYNAVLSLDWTYMIFVIAKASMLLGGLVCLFNATSPICHFFGLITFILSILSLIVSLFLVGLSGFRMDTIFTALLGWIFILAI